VKAFIKFSIAQKCPYVDSRLRTRAVRPAKLSDCAWITGKAEVIQWNEKKSKFGKGCMLETSSRSDFLRESAFRGAIYFVGSPRLPRSSAPSVIVVGAGAFGGWTALSLVQRGARVTLLDAWDREILAPVQAVRLAPYEPRMVPRPFCT